MTGSTTDLTPTETAREARVSAEQMRAVLGMFCTGIAVVTSSEDSGPIGFTCQSLSSLSLDPPLLTINPARTSTTWPRVRQVGTFAVNVLAHEQTAISNGFARSGTDKFRDVGWTPGQFGNPLIDGALAWAECRLWAEYDGGDHTIVVAEVLAMEGNLGARPLLYFRGGYSFLETSDGPA